MLLSQKDSTRVFCFAEKMEHGLNGLDGFKRISLHPQCPQEARFN